MSNSGPDFSKLGYNRVEDPEEELEAGTVTLDADQITPVTTAEQLNPQEQNDIETAALDPNIIVEDGQAEQVFRTLETPEIIDTNNQEAKTPEQTISDTVELADAIADGAELTGGIEGAEIELPEQDNTEASPWIEIFNTGAAMKADNPDIDLLAENLATAGGDSVQTVRSVVEESEEEKQRKRRDTELRLMLSDRATRVAALMQEMDNHYEAAMDYFRDAKMHGDNLEEILDDLDVAQAEFDANQEEISELQTVLIEEAAEKGTLVFSDTHGIDPGDMRRHAQVEAESIEKTRDIIDEVEDDVEQGGGNPELSREEIEQRLVMLQEQTAEFDSSLANLRAMERELSHRHGIDFTDGDRIMKGNDGSYFFQDMDQDGQTVRIPLDREEAESLIHAREHFEVVNNRAVAIARTISERAQFHLDAARTEVAKLTTEQEDVVADLEQATADQAAKLDEIKQLYERAQEEYAEMKEAAELGGQEVSAYNAAYEQFNKDFSELSPEEIEQLGNSERFGAQFDKLNGDLAAINERMSGFEVRMEEIEKNMATEQKTIDFIENGRENFDAKTGAIRDEAGLLTGFDLDKMASNIDVFMNTDILNTNFASSLWAIGSVSYGFSPISIAANAIGTIGEVTGAADAIANSVGDIKGFISTGIDTTIDTALDIKDGALEAAKTAWDWVWGNDDEFTEDVIAQVSSEIDIDATIASGNTDLNNIVASSSPIAYGTSSATSFATEDGGPSDLTLSSFPGALAATEPFQTSPAMPGTPEYEAQQQAQQLAQTDNSQDEFKMNTSMMS